jgi:hypothetical protein
MSHLTKQQYEHLASQCDGLCVIDHDRIANDNPNLMPCVTCPFCQRLVDAILTPTTIACPECKMVVARS